MNRNNKNLFCPEVIDNVNSLVGSLDEPKKKKNIEGSHTARRQSSYRASSASDRVSATRFIEYDDDDDDDDYDDDDDDDDESRTSRPSGTRYIEEESNFDESASENKLSSSNRFSS